MATVKGGDKVREMLQGMADKLHHHATLRVGFLENATYPDGKPVAMIAAIQEFGAPSVGIPPRPFFRNMIAAKEKEWPPAIAQLLRDNDYDMARAFDLAGHAIAGQLRQSITELWSPPLAPSTVARKGHAKPLIETGHMLNSVSHQVLRT